MERGELMSLPMPFWSLPLKLFISSPLLSTEGGLFNYDLDYPLTLPMRKPAAEDDEEGEGDRMRREAAIAAAKVADLALMSEDPPQAVARRLKLVEPEGESRVRGIVELRGSP